MIDHVSLNVSNLEKSRDFYKAALAPLGYAMIYDIADVAGWGMGINGCSIGEHKQTRLWLSGDGPVTKAHLAFAASKEQVTTCYEAGLKAGGTGNGPPGPRENYGPNYFASFVLDPDGNNVEFVCRGKHAQLDEGRSILRGRVGEVDMTPTTRDECIRHATISNNRAEEVRIIAAEITDVFHRETMLRIANEYDELAKYYEALAKSKSE